VPRPVPEPARVAPLAEPDLTAAFFEHPITDAEFESFRRLIHAHTGISLGPQKRQLVQSRLDRRRRALGLGSFRAYCEYLESGRDADELVAFVNAVTTNKTDFFREPHHFAHLADHWAPAARARTAPGATGRARLWCAACSTGEEPYTLAMTLAEAGMVPPRWDTRILASDIDTDVLARAEAGIYERDRVEAVPERLLHRYFLRATGGGTQVRVRDDLQKLVAFRRINLMATPWPIRVQFDVIFCRNALIYFSREDQQRILRRLVDQLQPGGLLFLGHAESAFGLVDGLTHLGSTIYRCAETRGGTGGVS